MGLSTGLYPKRLFKYTPINTLKKALEVPSIYFAAAEDFNDPFELKYYLEHDYTKEDWITYLEKQGYSPQESILKAKEIIANPLNTEEIVSNAVEKEMKRLGILCLTGDNDNLLMWAHYADEHKGVCIEYDLEADIEAFCFPNKVDYTDEYVKFNYLRGQEHVTDCIFHKSKDWKYENEYRIVRMGYARKPVPINKETIKCIYFGCKCPNKDIKEIITLIQNKNYNHIQIKKAEQDEKSYKLHFVDIPIPEN